MPKDKQLHLLAGLALSILAGLFVYPILVWLPWRWLGLFVIMGAGGFGLFAAAMVGALKEIMWDWWLGRGTPEWWDFWATRLGGTAGFAILKLLGAG